MAPARLVCLILVFSTCLLAGETKDQPLLKIRVRDTSKALIPNATVQTLSELGAAKQIHTDDRGGAVIRLDAGEYVLSVDALGFQTWNSTVKMTAGSDQSITIELILGGTCSPCLTVAAPEEMQFEHYAPLVEFPTLPLNSISLRPQRLRFSRF